MQNIQNMSYGNLRYTQIAIWITFVCEFSNSLFFEHLKYILSLLVCFVLQIVVLNVLNGFHVIFCTYEHVLKICSDIFRKCLRSVNYFRTK